LAAAVCLVALPLASASAQEGALVPLASPIKLPPILLSTVGGTDSSLETVIKEKGGDRYYLIHLWSPACRACVDEMKQLDRIQEALGRQGFALLAIAQDANGSFTVPAFSRRHEIETIESHIDKRGSMLAALKPAGLPTTYLTTPDGWIIAYHEGAMDWERMGTSVVR